MRRLTAYTAREVVSPAVGTLVVTTFLLLTTQILRIGEAAFGYGVTAADFLTILALLLPRFFVFTLPISVLVGVVAGLARLSADREVLAAEAAGVSPASLWPGPLLLGLAGTAVTLGLTTFGEPAALQALSDRLAHVVEKNLAQGLSPGLLHEEVPGMVLYAAGRAPDGALQDVLLHLEQGGGEATLVARRARLAPTARAGLTLAVEDGELFRPELRDDAPPTLVRARFDEGAVGLDISRTVSRRVRFIGSLDVLPQSELLDRARTTDDPALARKAMTAWHRRLSLPAACFALAVFGMPLGLSRSGRRGGGRGFAFVSGVAVVVGYYLLLRLGEAASLSGNLPPAVALWSPNVLMIVLGLGLLWDRSRR